MKHLGDISKLHGWEIEPTDIIVGGSPCQDLSVAGKRKGIQHSELGDEETTRSGLFMEQIRIIKEMREYERDVRKRTAKFIRPRWCIWENVVGAFSSNKGEDFRVVLEHFAQIADPTVSIPLPEKGKWEPSGEIVGDGWSIAWTTHNAAEWSVPQRRARISVVCDFAGECAGEILFECDSLQGDFEPSGAQGEGVAETPFGCADTAGARAYGISPYDSNAMKSGNPHSGVYEADTARTLDAVNCGYPACNQGGMAVVGFDSYNQAVTGDVTQTLRAIRSDSDHLPLVAVERERERTVTVLEHHPNDSRIKVKDDEICQTLSCRMGTGGNNIPLLMTEE